MRLFPLKPWCPTVGSPKRHTVLCQMVFSLANFESHHRLHFCLFCYASLSPAFSASSGKRSRTGPAALQCRPERDDYQSQLHVGGSGRVDRRRQCDWIRCGRDNLLTQQCIRGDSWPLQNLLSVVVIPIAVQWTLRHKCEPCPETPLQVRMYVCPL